MKGRSLFDVVGIGDRVLWVMKGRSLFDVVGIGDRVLWVLRVRSLFGLRFRRSGCMGDEGRSVIIMINQVSYIDCYD